MNRTAVSSSNLRDVGYDAATHTLEIGFRNGGVYQYSGVPTTLHVGLMGASSKGKYFHAFIKDRFPCVKIR